MPAAGEATAFVGLVQRQNEPRPLTHFLPSGTGTVFPLVSFVHVGKVFIRPFGLRSPNGSDQADAGRVVLHRRATGGLPPMQEGC